MTGGYREELYKKTFGGGYNYQQPDYSSPLYTLSLIKTNIEQLNNLIKTLEKQLNNED